MRDPKRYPPPEHDDTEASYLLEQWWLEQEPETGLDEQFDETGAPF